MLRRAPTGSLERGFFVSDSMSTLDNPLSSAQAKPNPADLQIPADGFPVGKEEFRALLEGTNIGRTTFLATDFLNNFNEFVMLIELLPSSPDLFDDVQSWRPLGYIEHFKESGFPNRDLAIAGWYRASPERRQALEAFTKAIAGLIAHAVPEIADLVACNDLAALTRVCDTLRNELIDIHDGVNALIQGRETIDGGEVDRLLAT